MLYFPPIAGELLRKLSQRGHAMKPSVWKTALCVLSVVLLTGCGVQRQPNYRVVTAISVTASHNQQITHYHYTRQEDMRAVLNYLRTLETFAPTLIAADTFRGDAFRITLHRSDGTQAVYYQIADGYLQKDGGPWLKTDSRHASALLRLLEALPSPAP